MRDLKERLSIFFDSFFLMICIKNFSKSKKVYLFHNLYINTITEILFVFFSLFIILKSFLILKNQLDFTKQNSLYEDIDYKNRYNVLKKKKFRNEDIIINRLIIYNYLLFFFRSYILQNYFNSILVINILILLSCIFFIIYLSVKIYFKSKIRIIIFFLLLTEIFFLVYFCLGLNFLKKYIPDVVLNIFFIICYFFKVLEQFVNFISIYYFNKKGKKKLKKKCDKMLKSFIFLKELNIKLDRNSEYFRRHMNKSKNYDDSLFIDVNKNKKNSKKRLGFLNKYNNKILLNSSTKSRFKTFRSNYNSNSSDDNEIVDCKEKVEKRNDNIDKDNNGILLNSLIKSRFTTSITKSRFKTFRSNQQSSNRRFKTLNSSGDEIVDIKKKIKKRNYDINKDNNGILSNSLTKSRFTTFRSNHSNNKKTLNDSISDDEICDVKEKEKVEKRIGYLSSFNSSIKSRLTKFRSKFLSKFRLKTLNKDFSDDEIDDVKKKNERKTVF